MAFAGENCASRQAEAGWLLRSSASALALAVFSLATPAQAQSTQGVAANAPDQDPATVAETGPETAEQEAEGVSSREATGAGAESDGEIVVTGIRQSLQSSQDI